MLSSNKPPVLGGEMRNVTVYFSDIADFSSIAEKIPPAELVAAMNEYLSAMTDVIEAQGGFVDKYIGDAIVAVFGAPLDDPEHAANAVHAALRCAARLPLDRVNAAFGRTVRQRIGLNSGEALIGNIGSRRRFNYTVMGDMVNLASRLEGTNKFYGTTVIASEATVELTGRAFVWRELDAIRVKGRSQPVRIEPLGAAGEVAPVPHVPRAGLWRGPGPLSCARFRRGGRAIRPGCRRRSAVGAFPGAGPAARATAARPGLGAGQRPGGEIAPLRTTTCVGWAKARTTALTLDRIVTAPLPTLRLKLTPEIRARRTRRGGRPRRSARARRAPRRCSAARACRRPAPG